MPGRGLGRPRAPVLPPPSSLLPLSLLLLLTVAATSEGACYFSIEFQGQFLMQSAVAPGAGGAGSAASVRYSQVNITAEAIPIWGRCHRRIGSNVILKDSSGATNCIRCFRLNLRSANVLQVHSEGLDKCYTNEDAAVATCPNDAPRGHASKEIILYKTRDHNGDEIRPQYCPINGRFSFTYSGGRGGGRRDCSLTEMSELDTCPSGSQLNMRYRSCNFPDFDVSYACLGHWDGPGSQHYLVLLNRAVDVFPKYPRYRCAMYLEEPGTGSIFMAFSSDSTCRSDLRNSTSGYETLQLTAAPVPRWPDSVEQSPCRFPPWSQGRWQQLEMEGHTLIYRDHSTFKTYTARCLGPMQSPAAERFQVFARTQCGEQMYSCVWIKRRSDNVLEFQMGERTSSDIDSSLCEDANFKPQTWITQARLDRSRETPCPVIGEYTGVIPDAQGLCARLSSNCHFPESMFYAVSECTQAEVYEEREYRCLGQWEENGLTYTYTQRQDVGTFECFVGSIVSGDEIYIKEAGDHCTRNINPLQYGMKLSRKGPCVGGRPDGVPPARTRTTSPWLSSKYAPEPTKPWKPVTAPPRDPNSSRGTTLIIEWPVLLLLTLIILGPAIP